MIIEIGTLKSQLKTDNPKLLKALRELYAFKVPGCEFTPQYKSKQWNGKQDFISRTGVFRTGLLDSILKDLHKIECTPELHYLEEEREISLNSWDVEGFEFYPFQKELIDIALKNKRGVLKSPTGSGKTLMMAAIVKALSHKKIVILYILTKGKFIRGNYQFYTIIQKIFKI